MTNSQLKQTLSQFMDQVWNQGNYDQIPKFVAPQYEIKNDPGDQWNGQVIDHETFKVRVAYSRNAFPDLNFAIEEMVAEDDRVAASWIMSGTHMGDLPQLPATGRKFSITGITIYYFEDGKVSGHWQAFDQLGFLSQIQFRA
ncbi:MAG: ester cyclase [Candidatus Promineifilaceae bacterium]